MTIKRITCGNCKGSHVHAETMKACHEGYDIVTCDEQVPDYNFAPGLDERTIDCGSEAWANELGRECINGHGRIYA